MTDDPEPATPYGLAPTPGGGWVPVPDPTTLTTIQLRRELGALREILEARMSSMDHERRLMLQIMDERSAAVDRRFAERDLRFSERDEARQAAVTVALSAAKELSDAHDQATATATEKFEGAIREQLTQLAALAQANRDLLDGKIDALKERIDRGEGTTSGGLAERTERRLDIGQVIAIIAVLVAIASVAALIIKK